MKNRVKYFIQGLLIMVAVGCSEKNSSMNPDGGGEQYPIEDGAVDSDHFLDIFIIPDELSLVNYLNSSENVSMEFKGEMLLSGRSAHMEAFEALCKEFGDTTYNIRTVPYTETTLAGKVYSLSVTCDKDFAGIPAGEELIGIAEVRTFSFDEYISSGYISVDYEKPDYFPSYRYISTGYEPVIIKPGDYFSDGMLISARDGHCYIHFFEMPSGLGECTFTVTLDIGGKDLTGTFTHTF